MFADLLDRPATCRPDRAAAGGAARRRDLIAALMTDRGLAERVRAALIARAGPRTDGDAAPPGAGPHPGAAPSTTGNGAAWFRAG